MSSANVDLVRRWWARLNETGEPPFDLSDEECEITNPAEFPVRGTYRGHEGVRQWRDDSFDVIDDFQTEIEDLIDVGDGERVLAFLRMRGVGAYTRIAIDEPWAALIWIRDGRFHRAQGYVSRREAKQAAGLPE